jgi:hypothetical protein
LFIAPPSCIADTTPAFRELEFPPLFSTFDPSSKLHDMYLRETTQTHTRKMNKERYHGTIWSTHPHGTGMRRDEFLAFGNTKHWPDGVRGTQWKWWECEYPLIDEYIERARIRDRQRKRMVVYVIDEIS